MFRDIEMEDLASSMFDDLETIQDKDADAFVVFSDRIRHAGREFFFSLQIHLPVSACLRRTLI
jgi:hypothetical protein